MINFILCYTTILKNKCNKPKSSFIEKTRAMYHTIKCFIKPQTQDGIKCLNIIHDEILDWS